MLHPLAVFVAAAALSTSSIPSVQAAYASHAGLAPRSACPGQSTPRAPVAVQVRAMRCLINWTRRHSAEPALQEQSQLDRSSALRGHDIRRCDDFSHTPCGQPFLLVFTIVHYIVGTAAVGENLAWGQGSLGSARSTLANWLASPEHRHILLTSDWRDLGISLVKARSLFGRPNISVWVAQFGHRA